MLLHSLLAASSNFQITAHLDRKMKLSGLNLSNITCFKFAANIRHRLWAEWVLKKNSKDFDIVLCFGNLPPLFKLSCRTITFVQNRYLIDNVSLSNMPLKTRLRLIAERLWLKYFARNSDEFIVQTPSMLTTFKASGLIGDKSVRISPFAFIDRNPVRLSTTTKRVEPNRNALIYVASGEVHKNHERLIEAWCMLAKDGLYPSLHLTLDKEKQSDLCQLIEQKKLKHHINVENLGVLSHKQVLAKYNVADALIYPSKLESFGLPLIEAKNCGLPILASELDYVRDIVTPEETFDPNSSVSIARAVKRFMGEDELPISILNPTEFLKQIMDETN